MINVIAIAGGGALGAISRYGLIIGATTLLGAHFPFGVFLANILGSFLIGMAVVLFEEIQTLSPVFKVFFTVGFLGSFTTFSAYSLNIIELWEKGAVLYLIIYMLGSVALSILAVIAGIIVMKGIFS